MLCTRVRNLMVFSPYLALLPAAAAGASVAAALYDEAPVYAAADTGLVGLAAADLAHYLEAAARVRVRLRVQAPPAALRGPAFLLGRYALDDGLEVPRTRFGVDGFAIDVREGVVRLAGESERATFYAVAHFLEGQGIRWYAPGPYGEVVPALDSLWLPAGPVRETPSLWSRRPWYHGGGPGASARDRWQLRLWSLRNKALGGVEVGNGHMWSQVVAPYGGLAQLARDHPEWFHRPQGRPSWHNACILHPGFIRLFVDYYKRKLAGEPREVRRILSICPDDGFFDFTCPACRELIRRPDPILPQLPDVTDVIVRFANEVLAGLNAEYPRVRLCTYVYANFQSAPAQVQPSPNLIPMFAPLSFGRYHPIGAARSPSRLLLGRIVEEWARQSGPFGWYDYSYLCPDAFMPFTRVHMVAHDIPWLYERGLRYWTVETSKNWPNMLPDYYLAAKLSWDVGLDAQQLLGEYYELYFGAAGPEMAAYTNELAAAYASLPFSAGNKEFMGAVFTPERLARLRRLLERAAAAVVGDEVRGHRVRSFELVLEQAERFMAMRAALNRCEFAAAQHLNEAIGAGFDAAAAFDPLITNDFVRHSWYEGFYGEHVRQLAEWTRAARILYVFPDEWPAWFDAAGIGEAEGAARPDSPLFDFLTLKTYSACLGEQGWERYRGDIWYRRRFAAPAVPEGMELQLLLAGIDAEATVWLDGRLVGHCRSSRFDPHLLRLPAPDPSRERHVLTLRVNNEAVTELGVGGLIRPVCLVAMPRP